jgi:hypothetical protein
MFRVRSSFHATPRWGEEVLCLQYSAGKAWIRHTGFIGRAQNFLTKRFAGSALLFCGFMVQRRGVFREILLRGTGAEATDEQTTFLF